MRAEDIKLLESLHRRATKVVKGQERKILKESEDWVFHYQPTHLPSHPTLWDTTASPPAASTPPGQANTQGGEESQGEKQRGSRRQRQTGTREQWKGTRKRRGGRKRHSRRGRSRNNETDGQAQREADLRKEAESENEEAERTEPARQRWKRKTACSGVAIPKGPYIPRWDHGAGIGVAFCP